MGIEYKGGRHEEERKEPKAINFQIDKYRRKVKGQTIQDSLDKEFGKDGQVSNYYGWSRKT